MVKRQLNKSSPQEGGGLGCQRQWGRDRSSFAPLPIVPARPWYIYTHTSLLHINISCEKIEDLLFVSDLGVLLCGSQYRPHTTIYRWRHDQKSRRKRGGDCGSIIHFYPVSSWLPPVLYIRIRKRCVCRLCVCVPLCFCVLSVSFVWRIEILCDEIGWLEQQHLLLPFLIYSNGFQHPDFAFFSFSHLLAADDNDT